MMMIMEKNVAVNITEIQMQQYRCELEQQMLLQGATEKEISMIKDATIRNSIRASRKPEDVAWALLQ